MLFTMYCNCVYFCFAVYLYLLLGWTTAMQNTNNCFMNWKSVHKSDIPEQLNSSDCGVFVCTYACCLSLRSLFNFSQEEMPSIRWHITLELLIKELLP